jgi:hypothetical protein
MSDQEQKGEVEDEDYERVRPHIEKLKLQISDYVRVRRDLEIARTAWSSLGHGRRAIFKYLQTVFDMGLAWSAEKKGVLYQSLMLKLARFDTKSRDRGRFRVIFYCSSAPKTSSDFKVRNKWAQWLEYIEDDELWHAETTNIEDIMRGKYSLSDAPPRPKPSSRGRPKKSNRGHK